MSVRNPQPLIVSCLQADEQVLRICVPSRLGTASCVSLFLALCLSVETCFSGVTATCVRDSCSDRTTRFADFQDSDLPPRWCIVDRDNGNWNVDGMAAGMWLN